MKILQKLIATGLIALLSVTSIAQAAETVTYFHNDLLGSPAAATDESGEIIWRENYRPFGEKVKNQDEKTDNVIGYTGHVHDEDTGLTYMQARYYDPVIGRFYANDPVGFVQSNPVSFNRYAYANNNPYKFVDPDGEMAQLAAAGFCGPAAAACGIGIAVVSIGLAKRVSDNQQGLTPEELGALFNKNEEPEEEVKNGGKKASDAGKNSRHGDSGREKEKIKEQIADLEARLAQATGREKKKLQQKIKNLKKNAEKKKKGVEHSRGQKR